MALPSCSSATAEQHHPEQLPSATEKRPDDLAPLCVRTKTTEGDVRAVVVDNTCTDVQNAKVLVAFGPDSRCLHLNPGEHVEYPLTPHIPGTGFVFSPRFDSLPRC
ncbi:hypothetical protein L1O03_02830 [Corynebacterium uropygiale]|uniref:Uncharacterized protein n=1 Tax=Corynebacterium uropygiale TaxID=1775911 RepID=A0A9X1QQS3_9CORY|nr:hypothetical protein [Corynebacterium uropygiale]MCF4006113.1 hypothetical protein [Corynebacterium uropygiale]